MRRGAAKRWTRATFRWRALHGYLACACAAVWVLLFSAGASLDEAAAQSARPVEDAAPAPCISVTHIGQDARVLLLGEDVTLDVHVTALCASYRRHVETVFVVDRSGEEIHPPESDPAIVLAQALPQGSGDGGIPVGAVMHGQDRVLESCPFGLSPADWLGCLESAGQGGNPDWSGAVDHAWQMLESSLDPDIATLGLPDVRFVLLGGGPTSETDCEAARPALERVKALGPRVLTACTRPGCEAGCLSSLASSARSAHGHVDASGLSDLVAVSRHYGLVVPQPWSTTVRIELPEAVRLGTITSTEGVLITRTNRNVHASSDPAAREGMTLTLRLTLLEAGVQSLIQDVSVRVEDLLGRHAIGGPSGEPDWRPPRVLVLEPRELPPRYDSPRIFLPYVATGEEDHGSVQRLASAAPRSPVPRRPVWKQSVAGAQGAPTAMREPPAPLPLRPPPRRLRRTGARPSG